jgi:hypothetical protein
MITFDFVLGLIYIMFDVAFPVPLILASLPLVKIAPRRC